MSLSQALNQFAQNLGRYQFYLPGICLGGSQSAVAARFLVVVPYGVGLSLQIEVRKLALNPEFEKVKGPWLFTSQRPFW